MSKYQSTQITYNNVGGIPTPCDSKSGYGLQNNQYDAVVDELTYRPIKNPLVQANSAATMSVDQCDQYLFTTYYRLCQATP